MILLRFRFTLFPIRTIHIYQFYELSFILPRGKWRMKSGTYTPIGNFAANVRHRCLFGLFVIISEQIGLQVIHFLLLLLCYILKYRLVDMIIFVCIFLLHKMLGL